MRLSKAWLMGGAVYDYEQPIPHFWNPKAKEKVEEKQEVKVKIEVEEIKPREVRLED